MAALLKDALKPNLVQTLEGTPALDPRRSLRQHRPRLQLRHRHPHGPEAGRLRCHRGRLRRGPGRGKVPGHQVPSGGSAAQRRGGGGHRPGTEKPRRRAQGRTEPRKSGRSGKGPAQPAASRGHHHATPSTCPAWWPSTPSPPTPRPSCGWWRTSAGSWASALCCPRSGPRAARAARLWLRRWYACAKSPARSSRARRSSPSPIPTTLLSSISSTPL